MHYTVPFKSPLLSLEKQRRKGMKAKQHFDDFPSTGTELH